MNIQGLGARSHAVQLAEAPLPPSSCDSSIIGNVTSQRSAGLGPDGALAWVASSQGLSVYSTKHKCLLQEWGLAALLGSGKAAVASLQFISIRSSWFIIVSVSLEGEGSAGAQLVLLNPYGGDAPVAVQQTPGALLDMCVAPTPRGSAVSIVARNAQGQLFLASVEANSLQLSLSKHPASGKHATSLLGMPQLNGYGVIFNKSSRVDLFSFQHQLQGGVELVCAPHSPTTHAATVELEQGVLVCMLHGARDDDRGSTIFSCLPIDGAEPWGPWRCDFDISEVTSVCSMAARGDAFTLAVVTSRDQTKEVHTFRVSSTAQGKLCSVATYSVQGDHQSSRMLDVHVHQASGQASSGAMRDLVPSRAALASFGVSVLSVVEETQLQSMLLTYTGAFHDQVDGMLRSMPLALFPGHVEQDALNRVHTELRELGLLQSGDAWEVAEQLIRLCRGASNCISYIKRMAKQNISNLQELVASARQNASTFQQGSLEDPARSGGVDQVFERCVGLGLISQRESDRHQAVMTLALDVGLSSAVCDLVTARSSGNEQHQGMLLRYPYPVVAWLQRMLAECQQVFDDPTQSRHSLHMASKRLLGTHHILEVLDESRRNARVKKLKAETVCAKKALEVRLWLEREGLQRDVAKLLQTEELHAAYAGRRQRKTAVAQELLDVLAGDARQYASGLFVDSLLRLLDSDDLQYPPKRFDGMLRSLYSLGDSNDSRDFVSRQSQRTYLLYYAMLDVAKACADGARGCITLEALNSSYATSFARAVGIPPKYTRVLQGLWLLDHMEQPHESAFACRLLTESPQLVLSCKEWGVSILAAFIIAGHHEDALVFYDAVQPELGTTGAVALYLRVLLDSGMYTRALEEVRRSKYKAMRAALLSQVFQWFRAKGGRTAQLLKLPLNVDEDRHLVTYLQQHSHERVLPHNEKSLQCGEFLVLYHLQRHRVTDAIAAFGKVSGTRGAANLEQVVKAYAQLVPGSKLHSLMRRSPQELPELAFAQRMREHQSAVAPKEGPATPPASGQLSAQDLADEDSGSFQHAEMQSGMSATESSVAAPQAEPTSRQQEQEQDSMQIEAMLEPREASPQPTTAQSTSPPFAVGVNEAAARRSQATKGSPSAKGGHWSGGVSVDWSSGSPGYDISFSVVKTVVQDKVGELHSFAASPPKAAFWSPSPKGFKHRSRSRARGAARAGATRVDNEEPTSAEAMSVVEQEAAPQPLPAPSRAPPTRSLTTRRVSSRMAGSKYSSATSRGNIGAQISLPASSTRAPRTPARNIGKSAFTSPEPTQTGPTPRSSVRRSGRRSATTIAAVKRSVATPTRSSSRLSAPRAYQELDSPARHTRSRGKAETFVSDPRRMKVAELKDELGARGLSKTGTKDVLLARLLEVW